MKSNEGEGQSTGASEPEVDGDEEPFLRSWVPSGRAIGEVHEPPVPLLLVRGMVKLGEQTHRIVVDLVDALPTNLDVALLDKVLSRVVGGSRSVLREHNLQEERGDQICRERKRMNCEYWLSGCCVGRG